MTRVLVLLSRSPYALRDDGETVSSRILLEAVAECCDTDCVALVDGPSRPGRVPIRAVSKPPLRLARTAVASVARRRSLIHVRFAPPELVSAVASTDADIVVPRQLYMAQVAVDAGYPSATCSLVAIADVLESSVLRGRESLASPLLELEARRTWRDEVRCARQATSVVCVSETELAALSGELREPPRRLDLLLPPAGCPSALEEPIALFIGDLHWHPNADAAARVVELWPRIHQACPEARLVMVGRGTERGPVPDGVVRLGFVDDIGAIWDSAAILLAPVSIGGGVRVKILDAASRGVPVVATESGVGSISEYLPVEASPSWEAFVESAARLLEQPALRRRMGAELYDANRTLSSLGFVERQIASCLGLADH